MLDKKALCEKIQSIYPDIGECGIDIEVDYDSQRHRQTVLLKKNELELTTFLESGDAEKCMEGIQCVSLAIEINQLKDSIDRMPKDRQGCFNAQNKILGFIFHAGRVAASAGI